MRNIRGNPYGYAKQTQKFTLQTLLDFYEANPQEDYIISINNNSIKTFIGSKNQSQYSNNQSPIISNQSSINYSGIDEMAKKTVGLFSNLIQQMKSHKQNTPDAPQEPLKRKQYNFYYKCFQDSSPMRRGTSTKKVKQRALGIAQDSNFKRIELPLIEKRKENSNYLNTQTYKNNFDHQNDLNKNSRPAFIDLDFSFQEMDFEEQKKERKKDDKIQIKIIDMAKMPEKDHKETEKIQQRKDVLKNQVSKQGKSSISVPKPLITMAISKEVNSKSNSDFLQLPTNQRKELQSSKLLKLNQLCINTRSNQEDIMVEGAKKVESRIYEHPVKASKSPKDIEINFDLDLNFI